MDQSSKYWAAQPLDQLVVKLKTKIDDYYRYVKNRGRTNMWSRTYSYYNKGLVDSGQVMSTGIQGEFSSVSVNHFRNLLQHLLTMTVNQRPAFEPRATNSDNKSQSQTILARGLLDYYMREKRLERDLVQAVEYALTFGEGFMHVQWDVTSGETIATDPETQIEIKQGDIKYAALEPIDVIRDPSLENWRDRDWVAVREYKNRYDLAAQYPQYEQQIMAVQSQLTPNQHYRTIHKNMMFDTDKIPVYTFYHSRTQALPNGRVCLMIGDVIVIDSALPYRHIPLYRVCPSDVIGSTFGYTVAYDLLAVQETINALYSTILTNQETFGVQNILMPRGAGIGANQVTGGLNVIDYDPDVGKPEAINLTSTPPEIFKFLSMLEQVAETLSGVNSVARGDPQSSLQSGAALALVQSMAIQFSQQLQWSYEMVLEDVGSATIQILRDYASTPRVALIAGKNNRGMMKQFTGDDLQLINRVEVDIGNPMSRTTAGKVELGQMMLQAGLIKSSEELLQVINTGNLEPLTSGQTNALLSLKSENEMLSDGKQVPVLITDDHLQHINEHKCVVSDPEARNNHQVISVVTDHIQQHFQFLSDPQNAGLLTLMGQQPVQAQQQPAVPGPVGAGPLATGGQPKMPNQPSLPNNALTKQQWNPQDGGLK